MIYSRGLETDPGRNKIVGNAHKIFFSATIRSDLAWLANKTINLIFIKFRDHKKNYMIGQGGYIKNLF